MNRRLMERLMDSQGLRQRSVLGSELSTVVDSIVKHLGQILNVRRGSVPTNPQFGVPEFSNLPGSFASDQTNKVEKAMAESIAHFEPRLERVKVRFLPDDQSIPNSGPLAIVFSISGMVSYKGEQIPLVMRSQLSSDSTFSISLSESGT